MFHSELLYHKEKTLSSIFKAGRRDHAHSRGVVKSIGPAQRKKDCRQLQKEDTASPSESLFYPRGYGKIF